MTKEEMNELEPGDIVQGKRSGLGYIITERVNNTLVAVRSIVIATPDDWNLVKKSD